MIIEHAENTEKAKLIWSMTNMIVPAALSHATVSLAIQIQIGMLHNRNSFYEMHFILISFLV